MAFMLQTVFLHMAQRERIFLNSKEQAELSKIPGSCRQDYKVLSFSATSKRLYIDVSMRGRL